MSQMEYESRIARKRWECHGSGGRPCQHAEGCTEHIEPGDICIELLDEAPAYHSGPRICLACAEAFHGIDSELVRADRGVEAEPDTEVVRADELSLGDTLVTFLVGRQEHRHREITRIGVDGDFLHLTLADDGGPLTYQRFEKVRRAVKA